VRRHESAEVVHIRLREPMGAMAPFCGPWGSTFRLTRCRKCRGGLDMPYSTLGTARGLPFAILKAREALS
jgi:hypothetical protein